jgi:hypothetical protein
MIGRIASRYAELNKKKLATSPAALYALFDGLFQSALLRHLANDETAIPEFLAEIKRVLPTIR